MINRAATRLPLTGPSHCRNSRSTIAFRYVTPAAVLVQLAGRPGQVPGAAGDIGIAQWFAPVHGLVPLSSPHHSDPKASSPIRCRRAVGRLHHVQRADVPSLPPTAGADDALVRDAGRPAGRQWNPPSSADPGQGAAVTFLPDFRGAPIRAAARSRLP